MVRPALRPASKTAAAFAALVAAAALAGCEDKPYPSPAHEATVAAPAPTELAGAPTDAAPAPEGAPPAPTPAPMDVAPAPPPPGHDEPAAAPPPRSTGDSTVVYDLGPVVGPDSKAYAPPPPAPAHATRRRPQPAPAHAPAPVHRVAPRLYAAAPAPSKPVLRPAAPAHPAATHPAAATSVRGPLAPQHAAPAAAKPAPATPVEPAPVTPPRHERRSHRHGHATAPANATDVGEHAAHLAALQTALSDAVSAKGVLRSPGDLPAGRAADATLTLPADFAETVRAAAQKEGLADAAASVNLTAHLAGDGYTIEPDAAQSQPLTLGQPTEFHWTATANPGARGALHADVGAELLGGGAEKETLTLGALQAAAAPSPIGPKLVGAGILGLIVVAVLAWLSRSRALTPAQQASARRAADRRRNGIHAARPLDMTPDAAAPPTSPRDEPRA